MAASAQSHFLVSTADRHGGKLRGPVLHLLLARDLVSLPRCVQCSPRVVGGKQPGHVVAGAELLAQHAVGAAACDRLVQVVEPGALVAHLDPRRSPGDQRIGRDRRQVQANCRIQRAPPSAAFGMSPRVRCARASWPASSTPAASSEPASPRPTSASSTSPSAASLRCVTRKRPASLARPAPRQPGRRAWSAAAPASAGHPPRPRSSPQPGPPGRIFQDRRALAVVHDHAQGVVQVLQGAIRRVQRPGPSSAPGPAGRDRRSRPPGDGRDRPGRP